MTGTGFTEPLTFAGSSEIVFDEMYNIQSGTLVGVTDTDATHFRRINDVNYAFITITPATMATSLEGTTTDGARYFRTFGEVDYVFQSYDETSMAGRVDG